MDLVEFEDAYSKVTLVSTIRAFSLVVRALAAMLETLVRIQYIALLHASCLLECGEGGKHTCLIHMHSTVRICPLQPFTAQTAKLIFISTNSGTHDECRAFSTRDEEWRSHFVYTEGFTTQVRVLPRRPFKYDIRRENCNAIRQTQLIANQLRERVART